MTSTKQPHIQWDSGTAYDFFISLWILHNPEVFGLRPSWAAGVRSRLTAPHRQILEQAQIFLPVPIKWAFSLPEPKDALSALSALNQLAPEERLSALTFPPPQDQSMKERHALLRSLEGKQRLSANLERQIKSSAGENRRNTPGYARALFSAWSDRRLFGESYLAALESYYQNFFQEEEPRLAPAIQNAVQSAQEQAQQQDFISLLEALSAGVRMDWAMERKDIILIPSFWSAPFVFFESLDDESGIVVFGARPRGVSLVPGELVPEELLNALKALADPTRLKILHYLLEGPATPSELAKVLRLRPPTVVHHLHSLRLAELVLVSVSSEGERRYAIRRAGIQETVTHLHKFLDEP